jgi:eukaryotic-like serine/threonine-protein kinase
MDAERWRQVDNLLQSVLLVSEERRDEFLRQACAGDVDLEQEVKSLLSSHGKVGGFLEHSAMEVAAKAVPLTEVLVAGDAILGQTIAHYCVLRKLGSGGMGAVYEAEDLRLGRRVAIKMLLDPQVTTGKGLLRLEQEARVIFSLNHPHICTLYEVGGAWRKTRHRNGTA